MSLFSFSLSYIHSPLEMNYAIEIIIYMSLIYFPVSLKS